MGKNVYYVWIIVLINLSPICGNKLSESCKYENGTAIMCKCIGNEKFLLPINFNYENLTRLIISSCTSAELHFYSLPNANSIVDLTIENISESLSFDPMLVSRVMGTFEIKNVGKIYSISHDTFTSVISIDRFIIQDTTIENFDEQFTSIKIGSLIFKNVTFQKMLGINFSSKRAKSLKIVNTIMRNFVGDLNFAEFESIELMNSTFEFQKPGAQLSIHGTSAKIYNCNFYNVSLNVVTKRNIVMKNNCADGRSSARLLSDQIISTGNRFPNQITYMNITSMDTQVQANNNIVCIATNCKCPKSFRRNSGSQFSYSTHLGLILIFALYFYSR